MKKTQGEKIRAIVQHNLRKEKQVERENEFRMSRMIESMRIENDGKLKRVANENAEMVRRLMCQNDEDSEKMMARQRKDESVMRQEDSQVSAPECPVCLDQMLSPLRIFQCRDGHLVCEICRDGLPSAKCPECRGTMTGRATGMEQFLRTVHQIP